MIGTAYFDHINKRIIFVSPGLSGPGAAYEFGTFYATASGGRHRVVSKIMPMVATKECAQGNLDAYAIRKGFKEVKVES